MLDVGFVKRVYDSSYEDLCLAVLAEKSGDKLGNFGNSLRQLGQEDLYFLAWKILQKDLVYETHFLVCDFFVHKRAPLLSEKWKEVFTSLDEVKNRLLLYPRGSYKSTIDVVDAVQWIICFPNIRILFLTGDKELGRGFLSDLQDYFVRGDEPTLFQLLFSEHCIDVKDKYERKFITPARTESLTQPTAEYNSLESSLSGRHYDVIKPDDAVTNENSQTLEGLVKVRRNFYINRKMLMPYGYCDGIGTRYSDADLWGYMIEKAREYEKENGQLNLKYLCAASYIVKPEAAYKTEDELTEDDVILLFPKVLTWKFLMKERHDDPESFASQYMNKPLSKKKVRASEDLVRSHTIPCEQLPVISKIYIQWDLAYSAKNGRDFAVGAIGAVDEQNRLFILDVSRDRYPTGRDLAFVIVNLIARHNPELTRIEDSVGARWLESDILFWAQQMGIEPRIEWVAVDNTPGAKEARIRVLVETLLPAGRVWFSSAISCYEDMMAELTKFNRKDDIADALSRLVEVLPQRPLEVPESEKVQRQNAWNLLRAKMTHDMIYGTGAYAPIEPPPQTPEPEGIQVRDYFGTGEFEK